MKIRNGMKVFNYYVSDNLFIILFTFIFILAFIYSYYIGDTFRNLVSMPNFIDGIIFFFQEPIIIISIILLPMLIVSINVMYRIENLGSNLIRYNTKREYLDSLIDYCFKVNTVFFLISIFITMIVTFCLISSQISICYIYEYKTINLLYLVVYLFKLYFIGQWLAILSVLIFKLEKQILSVFMNLLVYLSSFLTISDKVISSVFNMPLLISDYFKMLKYNSFLLEIICFIIFSILLMLMGNFIYKICGKKIEKIGVV